MDAVINPYGGASARYKTTYTSWRNAKKRCFIKTYPTYSYYGGRGITMCNRWKDDFLAFLADMGERPVGTSLDRINNDGNYEPGNCRWADRKTQRNNQRPGVIYRVNGPRVEKACAQCGKAFSVVPCAASRRKHCSRKCRGVRIAGMRPRANGAFAKSA